MPLQGVRAAILLAQKYEDQEFWYPYYRLKEEGAELTVVASRGGEEYLSLHQYPAKSDRGAADVNAADFDMIIIPGGFSPDYMRRDDDMVEFVRDAAELNKPIAAICHGPWMLCCTDALRGRRATSFKSVRYDMINAGAIWVDEACVEDGNIITSRSPDDLTYFLPAIIRAAEIYSGGGFRRKEAA
ncbi:MAG: type 1 glutamine amidotransferase [Planctomycetes bacterium]|jgi:protease I|nr:type 1 glutamine amidotransferase [Planctomycetota bacterium]